VVAPCLVGLGIGACDLPARLAYDVARRDAGRGQLVDGLAAEPGEAVLRVALPDPISGKAGDLGEPPLA